MWTRNGTRAYRMGRASALEARFVALAELVGIESERKGRRLFFKDVALAAGKTGEPGGAGGGSRGVDFLGIQARRRFDLDRAGSGSSA